MTIDITSTGALMCPDASNGRSNQLEAGAQPSLNPPTSPGAKLRSRRRSNPRRAGRPSADPLHWWRTLGAETFDDLDLRVLAVTLNRYSFSKPAWRAAISGSTADAISLLARCAFAPGEHDLMMTCLLRCALAGDSDARGFLIQGLRRRGLNDLATSWRLTRHGPRRLVRRRKKATRYRRRAGCGPDKKARCGNRG